MSEYFWQYSVYKSYKDNHRHSFYTMPKKCQAFTRPGLSCYMVANFHDGEKGKNNKLGLHICSSVQTVCLLGSK